MKIKIEGGLKVEDIQKEFTASFPFLKIEFLPNNLGGAKPKNTISGKFVRPETFLSDLNKNLKPCVLELPANTTVDEVENIFYNNLRLQVCVMRKSGKVWIEPRMTGNWTLAQQNEHGRDISNTKTAT